MADLAPIKIAAPVASIAAGPSTSGFIRGGRNVGFDVDQWRDGVKFEAGPCDPPLSYPNKQALCDGLIDDGDPLVSDADPKAENTIYTEEFLPWIVYENIVCNTEDVVKQRHYDLIEARLGQVRSSKFAQEFSNGVYSGSPSLRSSAVPLSSTAYTLTVALQRLLDARVAAEAPGPHIFHLPSVLQPLASSLTLTSTDDYRLVFDNYDRSYIPTEHISGGGAATAPGATEAWVGVTGPYEYTFNDVESDSVKTIDGKRANKRFVQAEQQLFFRYETCNTFLAKVTALT